MDKNRLKKYFSVSTPLGPLDAGRLVEKEAQEIFFESNNQLYEKMLKFPTIITGRRGAGKTAFLHSIKRFSDRNIIVEINKAQALAKVVEAIEKISGVASIPEIVAELWEKIFLTAIFSEALNSYLRNKSELNLVADYLAKMGIKGNDTLDEILWTSVDIIIDQLKGKMAGAGAALIKEIHKVDYSDAKNQFMAFLNKNKIVGIILLDSLDSEGYSLNMLHMQQAVSGLLKCVGNFNASNDRVGLTIALPTELYHSFRSMSSNPIKDFDKTIGLLWKGRELLRLASKRISIFLDLFNDPLIKKLNKHDLSSKEGPINFFLNLFPEKLTNDYGEEEFTLAYILRHSQLTPRHLFGILNSIFSIHYLKTHSFTNVSEKAIIGGVAHFSPIICDEIFGVYRFEYPQMKDIFERCIPYLSACFDYGKLNQIYTRTGKKLMADSDFFDFFRMFFSSGIMGKYDKISSVYAYGDFEYTGMSKVIPNSENLICMHPAFSVTYNVKNILNAKRGPRRKFAGIYPHGAIYDSDISLTSWVQQG